MNSSGNSDQNVPLWVIAAVVVVAALCVVGGVGYGIWALIQ